MLMINVINILFFYEYVDNFSIHIYYPLNINTITVVFLFVSNNQIHIQINQVYKYDYGREEIDFLSIGLIVILFLNC